MVIGFDIDGPVAQSMVFFHYVKKLGKFLAKVLKIKKRTKFFHLFYDLVWHVMAICGLFFKGTEGSKEFFQFAGNQNIEVVFISARRKRWLIYTIRQIEKVTKIKNPTVLLSDGKGHNKEDNLKKHCKILDGFVDDCAEFLDIIGQVNPYCKTYYLCDSKLLPHQNENEDPFGVKITKVSSVNHTSIANLYELKKLLNADT